MIRVRDKRCARWRLTLSRNAVVGGVWVREQPQAARHDVAGQRKSMTSKSSIRVPASSTKVPPDAVPDP